MQKALCNLLTKQPYMYQSEMAHFLHRNFSQKNIGEIDRPGPAISLLDEKTNPSHRTTTGCLRPSTVLQISSSFACSSSASSHRPWFRYVDARLVMLVSVVGMIRLKLRLANLHHLYLQPLSLLPPALVPVRRRQVGHA